MNKLTFDLKFTPSNTGDFIKDMTIDDNEVERIDGLAKRNNQIIGRMIFHPYADGLAVYQIVAETKTGFKIKNVPVGDAWVLPAWGDEATIKKADIRRFV